MTRFISIRCATAIVFVPGKTFRFSSHSQPIYTIGMLRSHIHTCGNRLVKTTAVVQRILTKILCPTLLTTNTTEYIDPSLFILLVQMTCWLCHKESCLASSLFQAYSVLRGRHVVSHPDRLGSTLSQELTYNCVKKDYTYSPSKNSASNNYYSSFVSKMALTPASFTSQALGIQFLLQCRLARQQNLFCPLQRFSCNN